MIHWPKNLSPENALVHAKNKIVIHAPPEIIWRVLICAESWPDWYPNCAWIRFFEGDSPDLLPGRSFIWKTFGVAVKSEVKVFDPPREIGWDGRALGLRVYHGWIFQKENGTTRVITEEVQTGPLARLLRWYLKPMLERGHRIWLEKLKQEVEGARGLT